MWRFLTPYLAIAVLIAFGGACAYAYGAPAWVVHLSGLLAILVLLPGYERWENRQR
jgi:hypothetical protein